jgi:hypothetical protein
MAKYKEKILRLKDKHAWKARPGYAILVLDKGAVRFDFPQDWLVSNEDGTVVIQDGRPPDDNSVLKVSVFHTPPIDWSGLPLGRALEECTQGISEKELERKPTVESQRPDQEVAWLETRFVDPKENREAFSRVCLARGPGVHCLISFVYWADQAGQYTPVWDEMLRTLVLGLRVEDPTRGPVVQ